MRTLLIVFAFPTRQFSTTEELFDAGVQLADALAAAHQQGIIHRDLKPENIMVVPGEDCRGRMKILDFGLAKHLALPPVERESPSGSTTLSAHTAPGFAAGTIAYMAPEQLEAGQVDARTDIYALGLTLYEMATGFHPFRGKSVPSTIANILTQAPAPIAQHCAGAPAEVNRIIQKCLRKHATERYQSARELVTDLRNFRIDPVGSDAAQSESHGLARKFLGPAGSRPYRLWEFLHLKACIRCAVLVYLAWRFRNATTGRWSLILLLLVTVCCMIQTIISAALLFAGEMDRRNLHKYAQVAAPWLRALGLANGLFAFVMAALVAELHTFLALFLTVLAVAIAFTALVLRPAMDRAAIRSGE